MSDSEFSFPPNRLIHEKSPYLLQHAHNPVDWYPWGEAAFQAAKRQDCPIFLSIGYSTCHWCHVMEQESFENPSIAKAMNECFICIKVDREELPEVDALYMDFAQSLMTGAGGWPLNIILTPDLEPFFAATYLPPKEQRGLIGMQDLIDQIKKMWASEEREKVLAEAEHIVEVFSQTIQTEGEEFPIYEIVENTAEMLFKLADPIYGGMKGAPKFPLGYQISFLMRYYLLSKDTRALFLAEKTLDMMHRGGIYDHLGGGFSRYSVDEKWLIPHFEKMLYDNAILGLSYLEAWQLTQKNDYRRISEEIIRYLLKEMKGKNGGFYSAEDADSEGEEGLFYTWNYEEVINSLGEEGTLFCEFYQITKEGNFEGRNVLNTPVPLEEFCQVKKLDIEAFKINLEIQKNKLFEIRSKRQSPNKDDKVLLAWNGFVIHTLVKAGLAFQYEPYIEEAVKAARFIRANMVDGTRLLRRWREGEAKYYGTLEDYALFIRALLSLFEAGAGSEWLGLAIELVEEVKVRFKSENGAFFQTEEEEPHLLLRRCSFTDGAEPSANAIHTENLIRLYQITWNEEYLIQAEDVLKAAFLFMDDYPLGYCYHAMNLNAYYDIKAPTLVIALNSTREHEKALSKAINENFLPHASIIWQTQDIELEDIMPELKEKLPLDDKTTLYVCYEGSCEEPISDKDKMIETIERLAEKRK